MSNAPFPLRGEIWSVRLDPSLGAEMKKTRPAIVISSDQIGKLPLKLAVPITAWQNSFADNLWHVQIVPDKQNGLLKPSSADVLQIRCVDVLRFAFKIGTVSPKVMAEITAAIAAVVEFE